MKDFIYRFTIPIKPSQVNVLILCLPGWRVRCIFNKKSQDEFSIQSKIVIKKNRSGYTAISKKNQKVNRLKNHRRFDYLIMKKCAYLQFKERCNQLSLKLLFYRNPG